MGSQCYNPFEEKATTRDEMHRKPAMRKRSRLRDTIVLGVITRPQPLLFFFFFTFWMSEKGWLSNSNYHSLLSESVWINAETSIPYLWTRVWSWKCWQGPPHPEITRLCGTDSTLSTKRKKIGSLSHQTTHNKTKTKKTHVFWPNQEAVYYITTCR